MDKPSKIIKYDNSFNKTSLSLLTKVQADILLSVLSKMGREINKDGCYIATFDFNDIRDLIDSKHLHTSRIKKVFDTLLETKVEFFTGNSYEKGNLFSHYTFSESNQAEIVLTKNMTNKLIPNTKEYTILDLDEYVDLPNNYAKELYRILRQFRHSGVKMISKDELIKMLKPPKSYNEYDFVRKVLLPAVEENKKFFVGLSVNVKSNGLLPDVVKLVFRAQPRIGKLSHSDEDDLLEYVKQNSKSAE